MRQPEIVRPQPDLFARIRDLPQRYEAFIEKHRAEKAAENLSEALLRIPDPKHDGHHVAYIESPGSPHIAVELFHTEYNGTASYRIDFWEKNADHHPRRMIEYRMSKSQPSDELYYYHEYDASGHEVLSVKKYVPTDEFNRSPEVLLATKEGERVPFDAALQSQVYCEVANIFTMAQQGIEKSSSGR